MTEGVKMRRCEDEKMRYRPPLLEEPCAQTLSGKIHLDDLFILKMVGFPHLRQFNRYIQLVVFFPHLNK